MPKPKNKTQQQLLAEAVLDAGSGRAVAEALGTSQQSVSAWCKGEWLPRRAIQEKIKKLYRIPMPWQPLPATTKIKNAKERA